MLRNVSILSFFAVLLYAGAWAYQAQASGQYVGSETCGSCHYYEYDNFIAYSHKANSWDSISVMAPKLTEEELRECYGCHTTGYNQGGFISYEATPELSDVGCETCHGPGREHVDTGGYPGAIERLPIIEDCLTCHTEERNEAFGFRPLIYSGAH
ncbi:cytochrome c family protein [Desulfonatronovibrio magnus]|uniref:cytochrome c family protein n=1 Tax=Desulfonatronovibrio magnus TaxID=698827 RepID=UPI0006983DA8|nr:cytochrome c family protein [Desulfonatronovibrio magnus]RQD63902.1 MAG: cytochrome C [Desulfonatronovibrio sp. MSAO_Bac4]